MKRRTRLWAGLTFLVVLLANYAFIGYPLYARTNSLDRKIAEMAAKKTPAGGLFRKSDDQFIVEVLRRERDGIAKKTVIVNAVAMSCLIVIVSWTGFGLIVGDRRR